MSHSHQPSTPSQTPVSSDDTEEAAVPPAPVRSKRKPWTEEEHDLFLQGIDQYGRGNWKIIAENCLTSRTPGQIASHAQQYFPQDLYAEKRRRSIHHKTLEIDQSNNDASSSSSRNLVTRQLQDPNPNHHSRNQTHSFTRPWQRDISHPSKYQNHHNRNVSPPPPKLYIDLFIKKSDEGHLDILVRDSNQVKVLSTITVQGAPHNSDLSSRRVQIPYFVSTDLPPQHYRVNIETIATQTRGGVRTDAGPNSENVHGCDQI